MKITHRPWSTIRHKKDYTSNFMTREHQPITCMKQIMKKYSYNAMFLFYKGVKIGEADLVGVNLKKGWVHTDGVSLDKKYRKEGHGIHLYFHLIEIARKLGAKRVYSSTNLNENSRPMWSKKLPKFYNVVPVKTKKPCRECGSKHPRDLKFYIDL